MKVLNTVTKAMALFLVFALFLVLFPVPATAAETDTCAHEYEVTVYEPSCNNPGYTVYYCTLCQNEYTDDFVDALGHNFVESEVVDPTCAKDGYTLFACTRCGVTERETIEASPAYHNYTIIEQVDATCTENGYFTQVCSICDREETQVLFASGHDNDVTFVDATCTENGYWVMECTKCGEVEIEEDPEFPATGHNHVATVTAPTCETKGYTTHTCTGCGDTYTTDTVNAPGHKYTVKITSGNAVYTCKTCGYTYTKASATTTYNHVTTLTAGKSYIIAVLNGRTAYALSHAGDRISAVKITISGGKVTSAITDDMLWDYAAGKMSYEKDGVTHYLYSGPATTGYVTLTTSTSTYSFISSSTNKLKVGSVYLRYNGGTIKGYKSAGTTYLMESSN